MAVGFPLKTTYANGDVYSAGDVNDITGTINLLQTSTLSSSAGKNIVIGGGLDIWQRGTSFAGVGSPLYTADRWNLNAPSAQTFSRQTTSDTTNLPFIQYCARIQRTNLSANTTAVYVSSSYESVNCIPFAGKTVTLSFYARVGANWAGTSFGIQLISGTGTDQNLNTGFTGSTNVISVSPTFTTTWQRFSYTGTVASTATQLGFLMSWLPSGTAGANDYIEITGVQVELGSYATTFSRAGGTIQGELAACQRYYYRYLGESTGTTFICNAWWFNANNAYGVVPFPVSMRTYPSAMDTSGTAANYGTYAGGSAITCSAVPILDTPNRNNALVQFVVSSGGVTGYGGAARILNTSAYLGFTAEL
jgi:hypothetical protein